MTPFKAYWISTIFPTIKDDYLRLRHEAPKTMKKKFKAEKRKAKKEKKERIRTARTRRVRRSRNSLWARRRRRKKIQCGRRSL